MENLKTFFATFNHEIKTSLASLRLQAESLKEDLIQNESHSKLLDRLISDTMRLQVQLENSLYLGAEPHARLLLEDVAFEKFIQSARMRWPQMQIHLNKDAKIKADQRALTTVLNNLIQNALIHGGASEIRFEVNDLAKPYVDVRFSDNGKGFSGARTHLGRLFFRPTSKSGSGMGLFICKDLLDKMKGRMTLEESANGFSGTLRVQSGGSLL